MARQYHERIGARDLNHVANIRRRRRLRLHAVSQLGRARRTGRQCWGDEFAIPNACQPPRSRDRASPMFNMGGWALVTPSQMRDYADNQMQCSGNAGWTKGTHNVKFGFDVQRNYLNHYETAVPVFTFNGGATALSGGTSPNNFNQFADFLLGLPQSRNAQVMTPLLDTDGAKGAQWPATVRSWAIGAVPARPMADHAQDDRVGWRPVGVLPVPDARRSRARDVRLQHEPAAGVRHRRGESSGVRHQSPEGSLHAAARLGVPADRGHGHSRRVLAQSAERQRDIRRVGGIAQAFPQIIAITESGPNTFTPVGSMSDGCAARADAGSLDRCRPAAGWRGRDDARRRVRTGHDHVVERHGAEALSAFAEREVGYVANRQNNQTRAVNLNYGQIGGGPPASRSTSPTLPNGLRTTAHMTVFRPLGQDHLRFAAVQRHAPDDRRASSSRRRTPTHAPSTGGRATSRSPSSIT